MKEYSFITPDYSLQNNLMAFGFDCGKGWTPILIDLCDKIQNLVDANLETYKDFKFLQVKEKFGGLRVYTNFDTPEIEKLIDEAEDRCSKTCEVCGKPGHMTYRGMWAQTLCNRCYKKIEISNKIRTIKYRIRNLWRKITK